MGTQKNTSQVTHTGGLYTYHRLSYGAPSIFEAVMDQILQGIEQVTCSLDDTLIAYSSSEEQLCKMEDVLSCLEKTM